MIGVESPCAAYVTRRKETTALSSDGITVSICALQKYSRCSSDAQVLERALNRAVPGAFPVAQQNVCGADALFDDARA